MKSLVAASLAVILMSSSAHAASLSSDYVTFIPGVDMIFIDEPIWLGTTETFNALLKKHPETKVVGLRTGYGGFMNDALKIAKTINRKGLATVAYDKCYSACAYMWLAGKTRYTVSSSDIRIHAARDPFVGNLFVDEVLSFTKSMKLPNALASYIIDNSNADHMVPLTARTLSQFNVSVTKFDADIRQ